MIPFDFQLSEKNVDFVLPSHKFIQNLHLLSDFDEILYETCLFECWLKIEDKI